MTSIPCVCRVWFTPASSGLYRECHVSFREQRNKTRAVWFISSNADRGRWVKPLLLWLEDPIQSSSYQQIISMIHIQLVYVLSSGAHLLLWWILQHDPRSQRHTICAPLVSSRHIIRIPGLYRQSQLLYLGLKAAQREGRCWWLAVASLWIQSLPGFILIVYLITACVCVLEEPTMFGNPALLMQWLHLANVSLSICISLAHSLTIVTIQSLSRLNYVAHQHT